MTIKKNEKKIFILYFEYVCTVCHKHNIIYFLLLVICVNNTRSNFSDYDNIPYKTQFIYIDGGVQKPGKYEYQSGDFLDNIISTVASFMIIDN